VPDIAECIYSPFILDPEVNGLALVTGHKRYCDLINPSHPDYIPGFVDHYIVNSYLTAGKKPPKKHLESIGVDRKSKNGVSMGHNGKPPGNPQDDPGQASRTQVTFSPLKDETDHQRVYQEARDCPHRIESKSCCKSDSCGKGGSHEGENVSMGVCYPCAMDRLGISPEG
jgi:hypothetical protein